MSYPPQPPTSAIGSLQNDVFLLKNELRRKADGYKVSSQDDRLDALERAVGQIGSDRDEFLSRLQACEENCQEIKRQLEVQKIEANQ